MKLLTRSINTIVIFSLANGLYFFSQRKYIWLSFLLCFIFMNIYPSVHNRKLRKKRWRIEGDGCELLILFLISVTVCGIYQIRKAFVMLPEQWTSWVISLLIYVIVENIIFWNGIIRIFFTSTQLGIKWRLIAVLCGWIPIVHIIVLTIMIQKCIKEVAFENQKFVLNENRRAAKICKTKYPILMVHGVFFRDFRYFNYWGRIPEELEENGAIVFYGEHHSAASVKESGKELACRIQEIRKETGCERVNVIAHSKGGLDMRYAISCCGCASSVASLTTINTPHRGCLFAEYLLTKIPEKTKLAVARSYNAALKRMGDKNPDFIEAVTDLTASACEKLNQDAKDAEGIFYQSVGSKQNNSMSGRFPLNFSYQLVKHFDGPNDGLVSDTSFPWGERNQFLTVNGKRGISHGDMIDLNRENIDEFDVREFYVNLVSDLRERGY